MIDARIATSWLAGGPLPTRRLRWLTLRPLAHPHDHRHDHPHDHRHPPPHLSAASGLVCANGRAYVIADDAQHLAVFHNLGSAGELHRLLPGDLPLTKPARKQLKADLETLLLLPFMGCSGGRLRGRHTGQALVALGSGSRPNRNTGVVIPLSAAGAPLHALQPFDLQALYEPLRQALGEINIEGAMLLGDGFALLNRGVAGRSDNALACYPLRALLDLMDGNVSGQGSAVMPTSIQRFELGALDGVPLGLTDAAALPGGGWVFSAAAEDTTSSYADGRCAGSVLGVVAAPGSGGGRGGGGVTLHWLATTDKVEGIALRVAPGHIDVCMVTDTDDPARASALLLARL